MTWVLRMTANDFFMKPRMKYCMDYLVPWLQVHVNLAYCLLDITNTERREFWRHGISRTLLIYHYFKFCEKFCECPIDHWSRYSGQISAGYSISVGMVMLAFKLSPRDIFNFQSVSFPQIKMQNWPKYPFTFSLYNQKIWALMIKWNRTKLLS